METEGLHSGNAVQITSNLHASCPTPAALCTTRRLLAGRFDPLRFDPEKKTKQQRWSIRELLTRDVLAGRSRPGFAPVMDLKTKLKNKRNVRDDDG